MKVGMSLFLQHPNFLREVGEGPVEISDHEVYRNELDLADRAEPNGYDSLWSVEHHFSGYTMNPDVLLFLSNLAGRTTSIELGSMVVVLPWHPIPIRVAEAAAMLDNLSNGRFTLGIGRGLGRVEFEGLGVPMSESRERFIESAQMVLQGLNEGFIEHRGKYYTQERRFVRPAPLRSFKDRAYAAAVSPESMRIMAELGVGILVIPQKPWPTTLEEMALYRSHYEELHGVASPRPIVSCAVFVDHDEDRAAEMARRHIGSYYASVLKHYELSGEHFDRISGYEHYAASADAMRERGEDKATEYYVDLQVYGTPEQCVEKIAQITEDLHSEEFLAVFSYGGLPRDEVIRNFDLFTSEVKPALQKLPERAPVPTTASAV